jgi:hypothetical protein
MILAFFRGLVLKERHNIESVQSTVSLFDMLIKTFAIGTN